MRIDSIKAITNLQTNFMWKVVLDGIPTWKGSPISGTQIGANAGSEVVSTNTAVNFSNEFIITTRESSIPGKTRAKKNFRYLNKQISLPLGTTHDGVWSVKCVMPEKGFLYGRLIQWFYDVDHLSNLGSGTSATSFRTNATVSLLNLDGSVTNTAYKLFGLLPKTLPGIDDLSQESTDGHIMFDMTFAFDDILHYSGVPSTSVAEVAATTTTAKVDAINGTDYDAKYI